MIGTAPAKVNLALVVGPLRVDGKHEVVTLMQRVDLVDRVTVLPAEATTVEGFDADTLVTEALGRLGAPHGWRVRIDKHIPVAAGLGGGSSDAATALQLANRQLRRPLDAAGLHALAASVGADVPFFLRDGPQLATGDGTTLSAIDVPQDYVVLLALPKGAVKSATSDVYDTFDERGGASGFEGRAARVTEALAAARRPRDLAALPRNDLASSPLADELVRLGAFRADVSGAGPTVYGLFHRRVDAARAGAALRRRARVWITVPAWYG